MTKPAKHYETSQIINDLPAEEDYLGFDSYVYALKELILDPSTHSPLTLGIFGRWGTGKTTLMKMLQKRLKGSGLYDQGSPLNPQKTTTVWFDAWRYDHEENLWAAFLQSILNQVDRDWGLFKKVRFRIKLLQKRVDRRHLAQVVVKNLWRLFVVVLPLLLSWQIAIRIRQDIISALTWLAGGLLTIIAGAQGLIIPLINAIKDNINININDFMKVSNFESHIAFLDQFHEHFKDIVDSLPVKTPTKLVIFIDDLDRCHPEKMIEALDAIKLFADVPGCIYIIGLDHEVVFEALKIKYQENETASSEYLEKIIQLAFYLPAFEDHDMGEYIRKLKFQLPTTRCDRLFCVSLVANPRLVKRTINAFSFLWRLACSKPEVSKAITPVRLAKIVVIQQRYPDLYRIFKENPDDLIKLEQFFRAQNNILTLGGLDEQNELQGYFPEYLEEFHGRVKNNFKREAALDGLYSELGLPTTHNEINVNKWKKLVLFVEKNKLYKELIAAAAKIGFTNTNLTEEFFSGLAQARNDELDSEKKKLRQELHRFIGNHQLSRLMLFDELAEDSKMDDTCFAGLSNEAIQQYFTLTLTTSIPALPSEALENQSAPKAEVIADFKKNDTVH